jgi:preprotein translocase subunit SecD
MQRRLTDRLRDRLGRDADVDALISGDDVSITTRAESPGVAEEQFSAVEAAMNAMFGAKDIAVRPPNAAACYRPADPTTMELARDVLDTRLREMGMRKATITISGRQITVDTHTGKDPKTTRELLTRCGELRFMLLDSTIEPGGEGAGSITLSRGGVQISGDEALSTAQVVVRGRDIDPGGVGTSLDSAGNPCIGFALKREAARQFETVTGANVRRHLAIVYDGEVLSAPVIAGAIGARGQISGSFTQEQAQSMAAVLKSGALPVPLELVEPGETR